MIDTSKTFENASIEFCIHITIREKQYKIFCSSKHKIRWLLDVAMHKYDRNFALNSGLPFGAKLDNNELCNIDDNINSVLKNNDHLTILLKDEFEVYLEENKKKSNRSPAKSSPKKTQNSKVPNKKK